MTAPARPQPSAAPFDLSGVREALERHLGVGTARVVIVAMSRDANPKAVVLAFPRGEMRPALAAKVAPTLGAADAVRAEARALGRLAALDPTRLGGTVPQCLGLHDTGSATVMVTTVACGRPMSVGYHSWRHTSLPRLVAADFRAAGAWLDRLHSIPLPAGSPPSHADPIAARWPDEDLGERAAAAYRRAREQVGPLRDDQVTHGDFWCGNLLGSRGHVTGVIDWEHARFGGDGVSDRVRFALAYTLYLDRHTRSGRTVRGHRGLTAGRWGEPVRHLLRSTGWYARLVSSFIEGSEIARQAQSPGWSRAALLVGLGEIAALSDHDDFARQHALLLAEVGR